MKPRKAYSGVRAYCGAPGSGKSYSLVEVGVRRLREGRRVFTNAGFDIHDAMGCNRRSERYFSLEELLTIPDGSVILLDEAPVYVNSRKSSEFPRGLLYRVTQVRKDGLELHYSAMDEMMVDTNLRRVTFYALLCKRSLFGWFKRTAMAPIDKRTAKDKPFWRDYYRLKPEVASAYDTASKVWVPPEVIDALIADAERPWIPLTAELSAALLSREPARIAAARDFAQVVAMDEREQYREGVKGEPLPDLRTVQEQAESIVYSVAGLAR